MHIGRFNWPYKNHLELRELKGSVMKIKELHYKNNPGQAIGEKAKGALERYSIEEFNQNGNRKIRTTHAINPSLAIYKVEGKALDPVKARELSYYSIVYQLKPDPVHFD